MSLPLQIVEFTELRGVQTGKSLTDYYPQSALSCIGGYFNTNGAYVKRRGGEKYNSTAIGAVTITGLYDYRYGSGQKLLIGAGTSLYEGNSGSPSSISAAFTSGNFMYFETMNDYAFICNGADGFLKYDGTTVTNAGITKPLTSPTVAANTAGNLASGDYFVAVTFVNDSDSDNIIESNPCDNSATVTVTGPNGSIDLTAVPVSTDTQVTKRYVYVTDPSGAVLKYSISINDNTTTTVSVIDPGTTLLEYDHDPAPDQLKFLEEFKEQLFAAIGNKVYISRQFLPWYWPQGELDLGQDYTFEVGNSDPVTGIKRYFDSLLIFKEFEVYALTGDNITNFIVRQIRADERSGCVAGRTIEVCDNWCYFMGSDSVYRTNGVQIHDVGENIQDFFSSNSMSDSRFIVNKAQNDNACAVYDKSKNLYILHLATGSESTNSMTFTLDTTNIIQDPKTSKYLTNWSPWPGLPSSSAAAIVETNSVRWFRGDYAGFVWRQDALYGDGANVNSTATSGGASTLTDTSQAWTVNAYAGLRVIITGGTGAGQSKDILSNTADTLTVTSAWDTAPDSTSDYSIGGIPYNYQHAWSDYGAPSLFKRLRYIRPDFEVVASTDVNIDYFFDFNTSESSIQEISLSSVSALWNVSLWNIAYWDETYVSQTKLSVPHSHVHQWNSIRIENNAALSVSYGGLDKMFYVKGVR